MGCCLVISRLLKIGERRRDVSWLLCICLDCERFNDGTAIENGKVY